MIWKIMALILWSSVISTGLFIYQYLPQMNNWGYLVIPIIGLLITISYLGWITWGYD